MRRASEPALSAVGHARAHFSAIERHADGVTGREGRRVAHDPRAVAIPADGVAAAEHGQRTEAAKPGRGAAEAGLRGMQAPRRHGIEAPSLRQQVGSDAAEAGAELDRQIRAEDVATGPGQMALG